MRRSFDAVACAYDAVYGPEANPVMAWMRQQSLAVLATVFPAQSRLLEVGCGTGDEAIFLARRGAEVWITDISPAMVACARRKAAAAGVGSRVHALVIAAGDLAALQPWRPFDGVYSSFGALNCEPNLEAWADAVARLVRPSGTLVCSVMNRWCLWETLWYVAHGRFEEAFRRWRPGWQHARLASDTGPLSVPTRYLSAGELRRLLAPAFQVHRVFALPVLLPPPYLAPLFRRYAQVFRRFERWEVFFRARWPWRYLGDHVLIVASRRR